MGVGVGAKSAYGTAQALAFGATVQETPVPRAAAVRYWTGIKVPVLTKHSAGVICSADNRPNFSAASPAMSNACGHQNSNTIDLTLTEDTMWSLDGSYSLDGERKINARYERSKI